MFDIIPITPSNYEYFENLVSDQMRDLLENDKSIFMVGAVYESKAAGIALLKPQLEDMVGLIYIYVDNNLRHRGIGRFMITQLVQFCREDDLLLTCTFSDEEGSYLFDIFNESGDFSITREQGSRCSAHLGELADVLYHFKIDKFRNNLVSYENLPSGKRNEYLNGLIDKNLLNLKYSQASFNKKYSGCCLDKEGKIVGTIIIENLSGDNCYARLLNFRKGYELFGMALLIKCVRDAIKDLSPHTRIHMDMISARGIKFIKKLLPTIQISGYFYTAVLDNTEWNY